MAAVKRPGVGIAVLIFCDKFPNSVVLGQRKGSTGAGLYQLPGGHLEFGESWEEAAAREAFEETGLVVENLRFGTVVNSYAPEADYHYVTIFMKGEVNETHGIQPKRMEPDKCEGWSWTDWNEFPPSDNLFWALRDCRKLGYNPFQ